MKPFIVKILAVTAVLALAGGLIFALFLPGHYLPVLPWALLFFVAVTILVHAWQLRMAKKDMAGFTRSNMLVTFFKLVIYSAFAVMYIATHREHALVFVICLLILYLVFTFLEVSELTKMAGTK